jgi:alanyl aminopeptidase
MKAVRFLQTKPLPSYLVAFAVGPFETVDAGTYGKNKVKLRIVTPHGKTAEAKYAVESTGPILEQLEKYFGSPYPYEKLDLLALPVNFGAMEHPGLVTWGYRLLLIKPELDTPGHQRTYASIAAHELAHMWFGDLVTMAWWDDIWLNEAFATWMENKIIDGWKPAWDMPIERVQERGWALQTDSLITARRIRQPIEVMDDIPNAFDGITYGKGAAVIGMFEAWVGPELFQKGVRKHLEAHAWGNATAADFLAAISKEAGKDVAAPFATFLDQAGAPRVAMELVCKKGEQPKLELSQRRQLPLGSKGSANQDWQVPLCVRFAVAGKETHACTLLTKPIDTMLLEAKSCPDWVMPNDGMKGYYRSSLGGTMDLLHLLAKADKKLSVAERVGLLDDVGAAVDSGNVDVATALAAIPLALKAENRHLVETAQGIALQLSGDLLSEPLQPKYAGFIRDTFGTRALKLGLTVGAKESEDVRLSRPWLVNMVAVQGKEPTLRARSLLLAKGWLKDRKAVHADLAGTVLHMAADSGDVELHDALVAAVKTEKDRADRGRMFGALSGFRDAALVKAHLPLVLDKDLDAREAMQVLWGAAGDYRTRQVALDFLKENWDAIVARMPEDFPGNLVWMGSGACDEKTRDQVKTYFEGRSTKFLGGQREFDQAMEGIDLCIAWRAKHKSSAERFIDGWTPSVPVKKAK